jgi:hypothetical protein
MVNKTPEKGLLNGRWSELEFLNFYGEPKNRFQETITQPGWPVRQPIPNRFLAPIDCLKIQAQGSI